jgi:hypothetical protein
MGQETILENNNEDVITKTFQEDVHLITEYLHRFKKTQTLRYRFLSAMVNGFGTVLGATVLVSVVVFILKQFANIQLIEPLVSRIVQIVQSTK